MTSASLSCPICSRMRGDSGSASSPMTASGVGMAQTIKKMCQALKCSCPSSTTITPKNTHVDTNHEQRKEICWKRIDILPHANPKTVTQFSGGTSHQQSIPAVFRSIVFAWFSLLVAWPHKQHPPIAGFKCDSFFCSFVFRFPTVSPTHIIPVTCVSTTYRDCGQPNFSSRLGRITGNPSLHIPSSFLPAF